MDSLQHPIACAALTTPAASTCRCPTGAPSSRRPVSPWELPAAPRNASCTAAAADLVAAAALVIAASAAALLPLLLVVGGPKRPNALMLLVPIKQLRPPAHRLAVAAVMLQLLLLPRTLPAARPRPPLPHLRAH